ncbi:MAG TPA: hypothetical protein VI299_19345 [Polyangiales bacterium]
MDESEPPVSDDAGSTATPDSGVTPVFPDGGTFMHGTGSCCETHATPGCGNADLEVCVCEKDPSCCTTAWGPQCTIIVEQKFCQPGVHECVCEKAPDCCQSGWDSRCDSTARVLCKAIPGCF